MQIPWLLLFPLNPLGTLARSQGRGIGDPPSRYDAKAFYHPESSHHGTTNAKESYFLSEDIRMFDAPFFNISANEAGNIDPQQRLLLETVYESIEAAGQRLDTLQGSPTGVFCGVMGDDWEHRVSFDDKAIPRYAATGLARNNIANRVSYFFDWHGPSLVVDTACSSSLVAMHQAVTALRQHECSVAVAAGTNLLLHPNMYISTSNLQMLSPDGRSQMWSENANGYARGEGIASIVLKRLSDAVADGDAIECVIRATGVNQDGRTMGITMPSSTAQLELIKSTYAQAGLDPSKRPEDRCQYFEAHGTGTLAGDPQEASAIYNAFFAQLNPPLENDQLHVGSIKTVIGHTEGTAGLAGIIKASLCIQQGSIAPNLLYERPNPSLQPYLGNLKIPTEVTPWPVLAPGVPRRVSVNSFGFGGTNAHAILEGYDSEANQEIRGGMHTDAAIPTVLPFAFSAASNRSLDALLASYLVYLQANPTVDLLNLAWTLLQRRSSLAFRVTLWAPSIGELRYIIKKELDSRKANKTTSISPQRKLGQKKVLGIFTGQGAQWPQMGLDLVTHSKEAQRWFEEMQQSLMDLPDGLRPQFSLFDELSAPRPSSRLQEAAVSQPLCIALQIVLARFFSKLGLSFNSVIGHSSGEIAAAHAAGFISASDAIRLAYLRGHFAGLAGTENGQSGAMLAVGLSFEEANDLCSEPELQGRVVMAASNSPSSITLSGDQDAIKYLEQRLSDEGKFARLLRVDTAYHSHHMQPCSAPYLQAMNMAQINLGSNITADWYSSVHAGQNLNLAQHGHSISSGEYWKDNMVNTVLFSHALVAAMTAEDGPPDVIIEIGPHPALKGPAQATIEEVLPQVGDLKIPYIGLSSRGTSGIESFANAIGQLTEQLGSDFIDLASYSRMFHQQWQPSLLKNLPKYTFDHQHPHWFESRKLRKFLSERGPPNPLLGSIDPDSAEGELRWRHYLRREEIEWLDGHKIQSRTVFPATGYLAMALEASGIFAADRYMHLIKVHDLIINQAISFSDDDTAGVEILFRLGEIESQNNQTEASFSCHASIGEALTLCASGRVIIEWGEPDATLLPQRTSAPQDMSPLEIDDFYSWLAQIGYGYTGDFQGITSLSRQKDVSSGQMINLGNIKESSFLLHPAMLDTSLQMLLGAMGSPGDGQLETLLVPTRIKRIAINPAYFGRAGALAAGSYLFSDAAVTQLDADGCSGAVDIFTSDGHGIVQMEGILISPLFKADRERQPFTEIVWGPLTPDAGLQPSLHPELAATSSLLEQISLIYINLVRSQITQTDLQHLDWHRSRVIAWMDHVLSLTRAGKHATCRPEWLDCTQTDVDLLLKKIAPSVAGDLAQIVGANMLRFLRGETTILEEVRKDDVIGKFYTDEPESKAMNCRLADLVGQLSFRYPRMKILEIGGGSGSATKPVLERIGHSYHSYTFTDISVGYFEEAQTQFAEHSDQFIYQVLDIERDPAEQGFEKGTYDLIIAANVLHATRSMENTLGNVRSLLKPGGYLGLMEVTNTDVIRISFDVGGFEGWWLGEDDGRIWGPMVSPNGWDQLLQRSGFGGVDILATLGNPRLNAYSVIISQAVDDRMTLLRDPMSTARVPGHQSNRLLIVGGSTDHTIHLISHLSSLLKPYFDQILCMKSLEPLGLGMEQVSGLTVLSLSDLDQPTFWNLTKDRLRGLQTLSQSADKMLWVSAGPESTFPHVSMTKGWLKCLSYEHPDAQYQHLNVADTQDCEPSLLAATVMRLTYAPGSNDYTLPNLTWSTEPELVFQNGAMRIPRIQRSQSMNDRLRSSRQPLEQRVNPSDCKIFVPPSASDQFILRKDIKGVTDMSPSLIRIRTRYSSARAVCVGTGGSYLHLAIGEEEESRTRILAFTMSQSSVIHVPAKWFYELPKEVRPKDENEFLQGALAAIVASVLVRQAVPGSFIWVHEADERLQEAVSVQAIAKGVRVHYTTSEPTLDKRTTFIHSLTSSRALAEFIPEDVSVAACFGSKGHERDSIFTRASSHLPKDVIRQTEDFFYRTEPVSPKTGRMGSQQLTDILTAASWFAAGFIGSHGFIQPMDIQDLSRLSKPIEPNLILDWHPSRGSPISVRVEPASAHIKLSSQKTYLLAGMAGDLGRSLCQWLITRGARNIVLTSRNPNVDVKWIENMSKSGIRVFPMKMDLSKRESVIGVYNAIQRHLPPIGGVVNGALVLNDSPFDETSLEDMNSTFEAKVEGSTFLDELTDSKNLDFFILFGSLVGNVGNANQSAYAAATNFQSSLIHQRRTRNQVGSIIQPGIISGVGFMSRNGPRFARFVGSSLGSLLLPECEIHEIFAEAILAGHPSSGRNPELGAGMTFADPLTQPDIIWYQNPLCWDFVEYRIQASAQDHGGGGSSGSMNTQLQSATTMGEVIEIVTIGLADKVRSKFNLGADASVTSETRLRDLGIDSLVAVDLRKWFAKELSIEIPMLQILNGSSLWALTVDAVTRLPANLIPGVGDRTPAPKGSGTPPSSYGIPSRASQSSASSSIPRISSPSSSGSE
ncbi:type I iterative polyketide synthase [Penicillium longicatenatum]|nr:type I iterative polyketide synthase [Penicillium longicatenatum]